MALANFAWIVAASGKRVLAIDWDLEAPGLHRFFRPFLTDSDLFETDGLIDAFWRFAASAVVKASFAQPNAREYKTEVSDALEDSTRRLNQQFAAGGYIDFICAGRQGATYSERVNTFDWKRFYELGGAEFLTATKKHLSERYDWILIDSRTGVSDTSGICTIQMPDSVVGCFTMNRQSVDGITAILQSIRDFRSPSVDGSEIKFFPLATRLENGESRRLEIARAYARGHMGKFLPSNAQSNPRAYWDKMEISYRPSYAFEEILAAFGDASGAKGAADSMLSQVEGMAQIVAGEPQLHMPEVLDEDRARVLELYAFDGRIPQAAPRAATEQEAEDSDFRRRVIAKQQVWRKSRFNWRYLLSRHELDLVADDDIRIFGRDVNMFITQSRRAHSLFKFIDRAFFACLAGFVLIALNYRTIYYWLSDEVIVRSSIGRILPSPEVMLAAPIAVLVMFGLIASVRDNLPYGVSSLAVLRLTLAGPFRWKILDYDMTAEEK